MNLQNQKSTKKYMNKYRKYGIDPRSLFWKTKGAAHQRFRQIWKEVDFTGKSVLDVGCGFGEMARFLRKRYTGVNYMGVDIVPEFIEEAKKLNPKDKFLALNYFEKPMSEKFDIVMASGTLNSNLSDGKAGFLDNMGYRQQAIKVMFEHTKNVLAFNMLGGHPQPENDPDKNIWYADSLIILQYCMSLTRRVILRANYHPRDFTVFMYKVGNTKKY